MHPSSSTGSKLLWLLEFGGETNILPGKIPSFTILKQIPMSSPLQTATSGTTGAGAPSLIVKVTGLRSLMQSPTLHSA